MMMVRATRMQTIAAAVTALAVGGLVHAGEWRAEPDLAEEPQPVFEQAVPDDAPPVFEAPLPVEAAEPDPAMEMMQIRSELEAISRRLAEIQQQAIEAQMVVDALATFEDRLQNKMKEIAPEMEAQIQETEALIDELRAVEDPHLLTPEESRDFEMKFSRFQQLVQQLQPVEREASMDPGVAQAREEAEEKMLEAMTDIEPRTQEMLEEQDELIQRFQLLHEQRMREHQAPPPAEFEAPQY